jgi:crotonobetainyl-CoA:carnitine CoA-transferase CaiB-like acyl-CoA transferase
VEIPGQFSAEINSSPYGAFATSDGYIIVAFPTLKNFGEVIGEPTFLEMNDETDTWTYRDEIFARTRERLKHKTTAEWLKLFRAADVWAGPVYGYADLVDDPQIKHNGTFVEYDHPTEGRVKVPGFPIRFSKTPSKVERGAPLTGQHTRDVLLEAGYDDDEIERLLAAGAVLAQ